MSSTCGGRPGEPGLVAYMVNTRVSYKYTCPGCPDCDPCGECGGDGTAERCRCGAIPQEDMLFDDRDANFYCHNCDLKWPDCGDCNGTGHAKRKEAGE
jgi:hypothetical protein